MLIYSNGQICYSNGQKVQKIMASTWDLCLNLTGILCKGP